MTGITGSFSFGYTSTSQLYHHSSTPKKTITNLKMLTRHGITSISGTDELIRQH